MSAAAASTPSTLAPARVLELDPALAEDLDAEQQAAARRAAVAPLLALPAGAWSPLVLTSHPGDLGLLVLEGLLVRDVRVAGTTSTELVGAGDVLRPGDHDGDDAPVPYGVGWTVLEPARVAVLDRRFATLTARWPEITSAVMARAVGRTRRLAFQQAVGHLTRVDTRLLLLLWHLADRWGRVDRDGVLLPLRLTHQTLGRLVGARRPSVTTALNQLAQRELIARRADGSWLLLGDALDDLEQLLSRHGRGHAGARVAAPVLAG